MTRFPGDTAHVARNAAADLNFLYTNSPDIRRMISLAPVFLLCGTLIAFQTNGTSLNCNAWEGRCSNMHSDVNLSEWNLPLPNDRSIEIKVNGETNCAVRQAMDLLESHPHLHGRTKSIQCQFSNGCLFLSGKLPSFHLKQLAQEAIRNVEGVNRIENQIEVAGYNVESKFGELERSEDARRQE